MRLRQIAQDLEREREITADNDGVLQRLANGRGRADPGGASEAERARGSRGRRCGEAAESLACSRNPRRRGCRFPERPANPQGRSRQHRRSAGPAGEDRNRAWFGSRRELGVSVPIRRFTAAIDGATQDVATAQETLEAAEHAVEKADADHEEKREAETARQMPPIRRGATRNACVPKSPRWRKV